MLSRQHGTLPRADDLCTGLPILPKGAPRSCGCHPSHQPGRPIFKSSQLYLQQGNWGLLVSKTDLCRPSVSQCLPPLCSILAGLAEACGAWHGRGSTRSRFEATLQGTSISSGDACIIILEVTLGRLWPWHPLRLQALQPQRYSHAGCGCLTCHYRCMKHSQGGALR